MALWIDYQCDNIAYRVDARRNGVSPNRGRLMMSILLKIANFQSKKCRIPSRIWFSPPIDNLVTPIAETSYPEFFYVAIIRLSDLI